MPAIEVVLSKGVTHPDKPRSAVHGGQAARLAPTAPAAIGVSIQERRTLKIPGTRKRRPSAIFAGPRFQLTSLVRIRNCDPEYRGAWELHAYVPCDDGDMALIGRGGMVVRVLSNRLVLIEGRQP